MISLNIFLLILTANSVLGQNTVVEYKGRDMTFTGTWVDEQTVQLSLTVTNVKDLDASWIGLGCSLKGGMQETNYVIGIASSGSTAEYYSKCYSKPTKGNPSKGKVEKKGSSSLTLTFSRSIKGGPNVNPINVGSETKFAFAVGPVNQGKDDINIHENKIGSFAVTFQPYKPSAPKPSPSSSVNTPSEPKPVANPKIEEKPKQAAVPKQAEEPKQAAIIQNDYTPVQNENSPVQNNLGISASETAGNGATGAKPGKISQTEKMASAIKKAIVKFLESLLKILAMGNNHVEL